jgi:hypothetical protein
MSDDLTTDILRLAHAGYCCSQILMRLALDLQGRDDPDLVRAMAGLCRGLSQGSQTCGVLTGAACVLGLYAGKGVDGEAEHERLPVMLEELTDWFSQTACAGLPGVRCQDILGGPDQPPDTTRCGGLVADGWLKVVEILTENGLDPTEARDGGR